MARTVVAGCPRPTAGPPRRTAADGTVTAWGRPAQPALLACLRAPSRTLRALPCEPRPLCRRHPRGPCAGARTRVGAAASRGPGGWAGSAAGPAGGCPRGHARSGRAPRRPERLPSASCKVASAGTKRQTQRGHPLPGPALRTRCASLAARHLPPRRQTASDRGADPRPRRSRGRLALLTFPE